MAQEVSLVGKVGSMALIRREDNDIDYNILSRLGDELRPGMIWVTSGAAEIGRLDYMKRNGGLELSGDAEECKTDYSAQGQAILMANYRQFIHPEYSVRQLLVEHQHFNDPEKRRHIRGALVRAIDQGAIPIINYNDPVSDAETRKFELTELRRRSDHVVECIDNDETAAVVSELMGARYLLIMTSTEGIYRDPNDPATLVREICGDDVESCVARIREMQLNCSGASRRGAGGAFAKLEFSIDPVRRGTVVLIAHARHRISDILSGRAPHTRIGVY
ncbi:MAG TPA: uridylate kinase [Candidatus Fimadaptatus faecigallinarum]|uniref:Uridylate kinase n=1 Tax=Candidatus Fimadaptatus faecigallinarum TaxID=2840814 RepID=A0A9D1LQ82_9FIRM|nr:uridylate kinase [Candidatus Fimadaptatus faecigallinarum]